MGARLILGVGYSVHSSADEELEVREWPPLLASSKKICEI